MMLAAAMDRVFVPSYDLWKTKQPRVSGDIALEIEIVGAIEDSPSLEKGLTLSALLPS